MTTPRERAQQLFSRADKERDAASRRDSEVFAMRKAQDAANQAKTERLRALRLAHEAANPKPKPEPKAAKSGAKASRAKAPAKD